jgi:cytochrome c-type protein NapC
MNNNKLSLKHLPRKVFYTLLTAGVAIGLTMSLPAVEMVHYFSSNDFCTGCHSMTAAKESFARSVHGGNNSQGFVADCGSCHLPTSNVVDELWVKTTVGLRHIYMEYVAGTELLDHEQFHKQRNSFVYESSCLNCHKLIEPRAKAVHTEETAISDKVHKMVFDYRNKEETFHCANCHFKEAHPGLKENMRQLSRQKLIAEAE